MTRIAEAAALGAFRECPHGKSIAYRAVLETTGPDVVARLVALGYSGGHLVASQPSNDGSIGCLDLYAANGDIIADHGIPHEQAWQWWSGATELRPTQSDCPMCAPDAYAATYAHLQEN